MKFPYRRYGVVVAPGTSVLMRPEVPLRVIGDSGDVFCWALVDTGADHSIIPQSFAAQIGVNLDASDEADEGIVSGFAGGQARVRFAEVTLQLGRAGQTVQWTATVGFVEFEQPEDEVTILGHIGCLEFFRSTFDGETKEVELVPTPAFPGSVTGSVGE